MNRDVPTFSRTCIFFLLIFSLLTLLTSAFQLSILSEVSLLNFLLSFITWVTTLQKMEPVAVMHLFKHIYIVVSSSISIYLKLTCKPMVKGVHEWEAQSFLKVVS